MTPISTLTTSFLLAAPLSAQIVGGELEQHHINNGSFSSDWLGYQCAGPGDLDGDGIPDYVASAVGYDSDRGRVLAYSGATGGILWFIHGEATNDHFGHALVALGDIDDDGIGDLAVAAPYNDSAASNGGKIYVLSGADGSTIWSGASSVASRYRGYALGAADINGDGYKDVITGMPQADDGPGGTDAGKISIFNGKTGAWFPDSEIYAVYAGNRFGFSVAGVGDWDGDGYEEVAVGSPGRDSDGLTDNGRVTVMSGAYLAGISGSGGLILNRFSGGQTGEELGTDVAGPGDVDLDGTPDLLAGAQFWDDGSGNADAGRAMLYSGADYSLLAQFESPDPAESANFGRSVAAGGDIDHDGTPDLLIAAPGWEIGYNKPVGAVFAYAGDDDALIQEHYAGGISGWMGTGLASIGDLDGDGTDEYAVGVPRSSSSSRTSDGRVYVFGRTAFLTQSVHVATGGDTIDYAIDFPTTGGQYKILVSLVSDTTTTFTGTAVPIGPLYIPLTSNAYPSFTSGFYGTLDAEGMAAASMTLPASVPPTMIWFAAIQSDTGATVDLASISQRLTVL